ncbi:MAG: class II aldolase/adducin family protein, partial [Pseudomonadota bacterium]
IIEAMRERSACLMANHGMVVAGPDLDKCMWAAVELETLAKQYYHACLADAVVLLYDEEIERVLSAFSSYGPKDLK